jgi:hypothetical protein
MELFHIFFVDLHPMKRLTENQSRRSLTTQVVVWVVGFVSGGDGSRFILTLPLHFANKKYKL